MKDLVGKTNPPQQTVDDIKTRISGVMNDIQPFSVSLTTEERMRTTKFRPGGERIVELIARLAQQYSVTLPNMSTAGMNSDLALAQQLRPVADQARALADTLSDTVLEAESECWWVATAYYSALVRVAASDPKLADALKPAIDFFATGKRKKAQNTNG